MLLALLFDHGLSGQLREMPRAGQDPRSWSVEAHEVVPTLSEGIAFSPVPPKRTVTLPSSFRAAVMLLTL